MTEIKDRNFKLLSYKDRIFDVYQIVNNDFPLDKTVHIEITKTLERDVNLFYIGKENSSLIIDGYRFEVFYSGGNTNHRIHLFDNNSRGLIIRNCNINFVSKSQVSFTAIHNFGGVDTHLDTQADLLSVEHCRISAHCHAIEYPYESALCGIENIFANSISLTNNYLFIQNIGISEGQQAIGIRNSGRFARIENNNIKANGSHNVGKLLEQAHVYGVYNTGMYMVFNGNNCVGEWGGKSTGLYNSGAYANITGNKILATHTIKGRTVVLAAEHCILSNNIITNTSRNPHFVDIFAGDNIINCNYMQGLLGSWDYKSGCGIFVVGQGEQKVRRCNIVGNIVSCARDFGIVLLNTERNNIFGNQFIKFIEIEDYVAVYGENSDDKISGNITDGTISINSGEGRDKVFRNYDEAVQSLLD